MVRRQRHRGRGAAAPGVGLLRITGSRHSGSSHRPGSGTLGHRSSSAHRVIRRAVPQGSVYGQSTHTHRGEMGAFTFLSSTRSHEKQGCQHEASNDRPGGYDDLPTATCKHSCRRQSRDNRDGQQDQCDPGIEHPAIGDGSVQPMKHPVKQISAANAAEAAGTATSVWTPTPTPTPASVLFSGGFCVGSTLTSDVILATYANPTWTRHGPFGCAGAEAREGNLPDRH
jgi:hypothetical protein